MKLIQHEIDSMPHPIFIFFDKFCHVLTFLFLMSSVYFYWPAGKAEVQFLVKMKAFEIRSHMKNALSL